MQDMPKMWLTKAVRVFAPAAGTVFMIDLATDYPESFKEWDGVLDRWTLAYARVELLDDHGDIVCLKSRDSGEQLRCELRRYRPRSNGKVSHFQTIAPYFYVLVDSCQPFEKEPTSMCIQFPIADTKHQYWEYVFDLASTAPVEPKIVS